MNFNPEEADKFHKKRQSFKIPDTKEIRISEFTNDNVEYELSKMVQQEQAGKDYKIYVCVSGCVYLKRVLDAIETMEKLYQSLDRIYYLIVDMYFTEKEGDSANILDLLTSFRLQNMVRVFLWFKNGNDQTVDKIIHLVQRNQFLESLQVKFKESQLGKEAQIKLYKVIHDLDNLEELILIENDKKVVSTNGKENIKAQLKSKIEEL